TAASGSGRTPGSRRRYSSAGTRSPACHHARCSARCAAASPPALGPAGAAIRRGGRARRLRGRHPDAAGRWARAWGSLAVPRGSAVLLSPGGAGGKPAPRRGEYGQPIIGPRSAVACATEVRLRPRRRRRAGADRPLPDEDRGAGEHSVSRPALRSPGAGLVPTPRGDSTRTYCREGQPRPGGTGLRQITGQSRATADTPTMEAAGPQGRGGAKSLGLHTLDRGVPRARFLTGFGTFF